MLSWPWIKLWSVCLGALFFTACVLFPFSGNSGYDARSVNVQTLNFFNQRDLPQDKKLNWRGDWLLRRSRLAQIDKSLRSSKPDVLVFQEGMERIGSPSESDEAILAAGALQGYVWQKSEIQSYEDTEEVESMGVAVGLPLRIVASKGARSSWVLGNNGYMTVNVVTLESQPIVIFNVQMPPKIGRKYLWYTFIQERVTDFIRKGNYCPNRVIIAGYMPTEQGAQRFQNFMDALQLRDSSDEFCNIASECYTATPENEFFLATSGSTTSGQVDKILVSRNALVFASLRNMDQATNSEFFSEKYNLKKLHLSKRYGWMASVRLPRCRKNEAYSPL